MNWKDEYKPLLWILGFFLLAYYIPVENARFSGAVIEGLQLTRWYARKHVLLCLVPAFFIAGTIAVFISQAAVIKYFGASARKWLSYLVASVSGTILAVCSCTVLPLFAGIHKRGAGLGPAITFLYSGPAINILAIILTARILGMELGNNIESIDYYLSTYSKIVIGITLILILIWLIRFLLKKKKTNPV